MSGLELRVQTLRRAVQAFRDTPGRRGRLIVLEDVEDILLAGDMHGNVENFRQLLRRADLAKHPRRHFIVQELIHGPFHYPSGGDKSHQLVDLICALKTQFPRQVHYLIGNHELAQFTGRKVLKSQGDLNQLFLQGVQLAYAERAEKIYELYLELFGIIPCAVRTPNRVFLSHSFPAGSLIDDFHMTSLEQDPTTESALYPGGPLFSLVWGRDIRPDSVHRFLQRVDADFLITGHIPCDEGYEWTCEKHLLVDSQGNPGAYVLFPTNQPLSAEVLVDCIHLL